MQQPSNATIPINDSAVHVTEMMATYEQMFKEKVYLEKCYQTSLTSFKESKDAFQQLKQRHEILLKDNEFKEQKTLKSRMKTNIFEQGS